MQFAMAAIRIIFPFHFQTTNSIRHQKEIVIYHYQISIFYAVYNIIKIKTFKFTYKYPRISLSLNFDTLKMIQN